MKIFVSWSGELSKKVAGVMDKWLPCIIQSLDVFFSPDDIEKGENWDAKLTQELASCNYGIICLTNQNVSAPWIHFEAGALAKAFDSRVSTLLANVNPSDINGPLSRYQATRLEKEDFLQLIRSINKACESALRDEVIVPSFDAIWPKIESEIKEIIKTDVTPKKAEKKDAGSAPLEEVLQLLRKQNALLTNPKELFPPELFEYMKSSSLDTPRSSDSQFAADTIDYFLAILDSAIDRMDKYVSISDSVDADVLEMLDFSMIIPEIDHRIADYLPGVTYRKFQRRLHRLFNHYLGVRFKAETKQQS